MYNEDWLDENEFPSDEDIAEFGDNAPPDDDPLTIGYVEGYHQPFWTVRRIISLMIVLIIVAALVLPLLLRL